MSMSEQKGNKLIRSYFLTYLAVLIIPVIATLIFYNESSKTIKQDIENENHSLLTQAANILDVRFEELNNIGTQLINSPMINSLAYLENSLDYPNIQQYFRARDAMPKYATYNDFLFDYFVFFNRGEGVLNEQVVYSYDDFYQLYMHPSGKSLEEWKSSLKNAPVVLGNCQVQQMDIYHEDLPVQTNLIEISFSLPPFYTHGGQAVLYVNQEKLTDILSTFGLEEDDIAFIESKNGSLLASNTKDTASALALQQVLKNQGNTETNLLHKVNGKDLLISRYQSEKTGFGLTIARAANKVYTRLNSIRWIIGASMVMSIFLGMLFSYLFSRRNSTFIRNLAAGNGEQLRNMSYSQAFSSLHKTFEDIQIANDSLTKILSQQSPYLKRAFLSQLLSGYFSNEESALAVASNIYDFKPDKPMRVVLFHFPSSRDSSDTMELQFYANCKALIRLSMENLEKNSLHIDKSDSDYVLLLVGDHLEERINKLVSLVRSNLPESINELLFVYVGNTVEKLTDVVRSWDNASSMIYIRPSPGEISVLFYKDNGNARFSVFFPRDFQRRLIDSVMNADEQGTIEILNQIRERNQQENGLPAYITQLLVDSLLNTLLRINTMAGLPAEKNESVINSVKSIMTLPINAQLSEVDNLYVSLCRAIHLLKGSKQQSMDDISDYIREHFMEMDMSLASVADQFHVSESYLSYTFKAQTGTNFFSYVEGIRIAKAKELLRKTDQKISDIAERVGYASANSFCRAFRRNTGNSASNYRNGID